MSMIEQIGDQLSEAANTPAPHTLAEAAKSLEASFRAFHGAALQSQNEDLEKAAHNLGVAMSAAQEAIGYVLGGTMAIQDYAQRVGVDVAPPNTWPTLDSHIDTAFFLPKKTILAKLPDAPQPASEIVPNEEIPAAAAERAQEIIASILSGAKYEDMDDYVDSGFSKIVFRLPGGYILKLSYLGGSSSAPPTREKALENNQRCVSAMIRAKGEEGFEQFVGWADEANGAIICRETPGQTLTDLSQAELQSIPQEHFDRLIHTITRAVELGIDMDAHPSNIMYEPQTGFTFIDYEDSPSEWRHSPLTAESLALDVGSTECLLNDEFVDYDFETRARVSEKFYRAYAEAFGPVAALRLQSLWHGEGYIG